MGAEMWFGTERRMRWIPVPQSGADMSQQGISVDGVLANGGGHAAGSYGSHGLFRWTWSNASSRRAQRVMQSYAEGTYGRDLIYFCDPLHFDTNALPKHWADPSLTAAFEAPALRRSVDVPITFEPTVDYATNDLPDLTTVYDLTDVAAGFPASTRDSIFLPVPPGFVLHLGAFHTATGTGGVFAAPVLADGTLGTITTLTQLANAATNIVPDAITMPAGARGVRLWIGKTAAGEATVSIAAMTSRLISALLLGHDLPAFYGPWVGGMGNTGCRFVGMPTYLPYSGVAGGQVGYAATLREVGAWEF